MANVITDFYNLLSGDQYNDAVDRILTSSDVYKNLQVPDLNTLIPQLQRQVMQGTMTAAQAQAVLQEASRLSTIQSDQESIFNQREALNRLEEIATQGGMTQADRSVANAAMNEAAARTAQQREAQVNELRQQGLAGSGAELAARLAGGQQGANANFAAGADITKSAQVRALQALQSGLQGNAALNTQLFDQQAKKAAAEDAVNRFNAEARNSINEANARRMQEANLTNFNRANDIMVANTGIANQEAMMPWNAAQQNWTNQLNLANVQSGANLKSGAAMAELAKNMAGVAGGAGEKFFREIGGTQVLKDAAGVLWKWVGNKWDQLTQQDVDYFNNTFGNDWISGFGNTPIYVGGNDITGNFGGGNVNGSINDWTWDNNTGNFTNTGGNNTGGNDFVGPVQDTTPNFVIGGTETDTSGNDSWFGEGDAWGWKHGGEVDLDTLMGNLTGNKYRYKSKVPDHKVETDPKDSRMKALMKLQDAVNKGTK